MNSTIFKILFLHIFILLVVPNTVQAKKAPALTKPEMECENLNNLGWQAYKKGDYAEP